MPNQFGGYDYDRYCILEEHPDSFGAKLRTGDRLGEDGGYTGGGLLGPGRVSVRGTIRVPPSGTPNIREIWRELRAAHLPGTPRPLRISRYFGESHIWAEVEGFADAYSAGQNFIAARAFEVTFFTADPSIYHDQEQGPQNLALGAFISGTVTQLGTTNVNNPGYRPAQPVVDLTINHPGTVSITTPNGNRFELYANQTGTYSINTRERYVTRNLANYHYRYDGEMPTLEPGQTSITLQTDHGTASNPRIRFFARD
jgi:hypothetical protein